MFEQAIASYIYKITSRHTGERVSLFSLLGDMEIPENFKRFAQAEVEEFLDQERLGVGKTGRFDFDSPDVQALIKEVKHLLRSSFTFTRDEFLEITDRASKFVFNYVIRPRWTLEKFLFKEEKIVSGNEVELSLRYLFDYPFYSKGIKEYLELNKKTELTIDSWKKLHGKIDSYLIGLIYENPESVLLPLYNLFLFASNKSSVPADALIIFFKDKGADEVVDRLEFARDNKEIGEIDLPTFKKILEAPGKDYTISIGIPPVEEGKKRSVAESVKLEAQVDKKDVVAEPPQAPVEKEEKKPFDQIFLKSEEGKTVENQPEDKKKKEPFVIEPKLEAKIIKKIFKNNKSAYRIAIHKIEESPDWKSASKIVEGIFIDYDIDPFSKYAVKFTDIVNSRFNS